MSLVPPNNRLQAACLVDGRLVQQVNALLDNLDELLRQEGFDLATSLPFV